MPSTAYTAFLVATIATLLASAPLGQAIDVPRYSKDSEGWGRLSKRALGRAWSGTTRLDGAGNPGISAQQLAVVDDDHVIMFDKAENNPLQVSGHSAWGAVYTISTGAIRPLDLKTNSFCGGGGFLSNGTLVSVGGNPAEYTSPSQAGNGLQALRLFTPCGNGNCQVHEYPSRVRMTSPRWYASTVRIEDGSLLILGGMTAGGYTNAPSTDNPTFEYYPPKGNGLQFYSKFLHDALNTNLFPISILLPDGKIFVAANRIAMLYDRSSNTEQRLPNFPGGIRVNYPSSPASCLLPLTVRNGWTPEVLVCGGTKQNTDGNPSDLSAYSGASRVCARLLLTGDGIQAGWKTEEMPSPRIMGDAVLTPDGKVFIVNGAKGGTSGYGNFRNSINGASNAANPNTRPVLYDPVAASGKRFSENFPTANIERMYHSTATLVPDGRILVAGSNPNGDVTTTPFATRYEIEMFSPPYVSATRPSWSKHPSRLDYNQEVKITVSGPSGTYSAVLIDLGYATHGIRMNQRLVELRTKKSGTTLTLLGPQSRSIYPPGYAWLYVLVNGVPGKGRRVMIGSGQGPPVDQAAIKNMLAKTRGQ